MLNKDKTSSTDKKDLLHLLPFATSVNSIEQFVMSSTEVKFKYKSFLQ